MINNKSALQQLSLKRCRTIKINRKVIGAFLDGKLITYKYRLYSVAENRYYAMGRLHHRSLGLYSYAKR